MIARATHWKRAMHGERCRVCNGFALFVLLEHEPLDLGPVEPGKPYWSEDDRTNTLGYVCEEHIPGEAIRTERPEGSQKTGEIR